MSAVGPPPSVSPGSDQSRAISVIAVWALLVIGVALALFSSVSLASGTTTVWFGVALAAVGAITAFVTHQVGTATKVIALMLVAACISGAIYDEVQLQHKRDQLNNLLNGN